MNLAKRIKLLFLFRQQDILKEELFECKYNWEIPMIREQLAEIDYKIKRTEIEV